MAAFKRERTFRLRLPHGVHRVVESIRRFEALLADIEEDGGQGHNRDAPDPCVHELVAARVPTLRACVAELKDLVASGALYRLPIARRSGGCRLLRVHHVASLVVHHGAVLGTEQLTQCLRERELARGLSLRELSLIPAMIRVSAIERLTDVWARPSTELGPRETADALALIERCSRLDGCALADEIGLDAPAEAALRADPSGLYTTCDLETRDRYRAAVEALASWSSRSELEVANRVLVLAGEARQDAKPCTAHVGFHLLGEGRQRLEQALRVHVPPIVRLGRRLRSRSIGLCLLAESALAAVMVAVVLRVQPPQGLADTLTLAVLAGPPALVAFWQVALLLMNTVYSLAPAPAPLPRLDFRGGIPDRFRTLVAVPCMLRCREEVDHLARVLERHAASTTGLGLRFCLLSDFPDAPCEVMPGDGELLAYARRRIGELNGADPLSPQRRFLLLHRPRRWNPSEGVWMGHERKRGKLRDLNAVILGGEPTAFTPTADARLLEDVAFVITLDVDNRLSSDSALRLIETMAHPLVRAQPAGGQTRRGYGVLQPRIGANPLEDCASSYERWGAHDLGRNEAREKFNHLHQDLFGEASYFGKGIYDVRAFAAATDERFRDNQILSHDLLEGCYARTAMVADVCVMEDSPADYRSDVRRRHRWMRGDWQNLMWILRGTSASAAGRREPATTRSRRLSLLSLWKVIENVRRNMVSLSVFWLVVMGFLLAPSVIPWTVCALSVLVLPHALCSLREGRRLCQRVISGRIGLIDCAEGWARLAYRLALRSLFVVAVLPFEALIAVDAALRSTWRLLCSGRGLLEWVPFADGSPGTTSASAGSYVSMMRGHLVVTASLALLLSILRPFATAHAAPLIGAWLLAPLLAWYVSQPRPGASDDPLMRLLIDG